MDSLSLGLSLADLAVLILEGHSAQGGLLMVMLLRPHLCENALCPEIEAPQASAVSLGFWLQVQVAKQRGSWDNVSVLVVQLAALHASAAGPDTSPAHLELCIEPEVGAAAVQLPAGFPEGWICPKKWTITGPHNIGS